MNQSKERDYVLGTHDQELERLGVQHRAWRPVVLDCWKKAASRLEATCSMSAPGPAMRLSILRKLLDTSDESSQSSARVILSKRSRARFRHDRFRMSTFTSST